MAQKLSPNSLIHCDQCGEDYSATYKKCPFCGAKNTPTQSDRPAPSSELEDTYVFDGQDLFDGEGGEDPAPTPSKGGKRLADRPMINPFASADINWPRVITFVCSLVIIVAAMVIVFTVVYPQLRSDKDPTANGTSSPSSAVSDPVGGNTGSADPNATDPGADASEPGADGTDPGTTPTGSVPPAASGGLKGFTTNISGKDEDGFTLNEGASWNLKLTFDPASWSGEVTYSISDTKYATVSANGTVTNVNPDAKLHGVILTITAGGISKEMPVYCKGATQAQATQTPATQTPATQAPAASAPPASQTPSGSGGVAVGKAGAIVNAPKGVYVRSSPSTSGDNRIASLFNGDEITVIAEAENGWYKISFRGNGGAVTEGYILGEYISTN